MTTRRYEVHPSVGVARVGNGEGFFLGPAPETQPPANYRDIGGRLKRQACEFRVFECTRDETGALLSAKEVTCAQARIEWRVHLVNRKGVARRADCAWLRNGATGDDRRDRELIIDPGARQLGHPGAIEMLDGGTFLGEAVPLGALRMDPRGRLVAIGGSGLARHAPHPDACPSVRHFSDNDFWYDDTSDGPVQATVTVPGGEPVDARGAWLIVMPPDFAPGIRSLVTWYDVATQVAVARGWRELPSAPMFWRDVYPILERLMCYGWVNALFRRDYGPGGRWDFGAAIQELADPARDVALRREFVAALRNPRNPCQWPKPTEPKIRSGNEDHTVLALTAAQYSILDRWANQEFVTGPLEWPEESALPDRMDRASLDGCIGAPLRPGVEIRDLIADPQLYDEPFHLDASRIVPGEMTQCNALPWQADFFSCRFDGRVAWWPSVRPDHVFASAADAMDGEPVEWARGIATPDAMVDRWAGLGIVLAQDGPAGGRVFVESERLRGATSGVLE